MEESEIYIYRYDQPISQSLKEVVEERQRQIESEGFDKAHDLEHDPGELSGAGAAYALRASLDLCPGMNCLDEDIPPPGWPLGSWSLEWWKPTTSRRNLVKAAALIIAELERMEAEETREVI